MESTLKIKSITVISYKILPEQHGGYVKLYVIIEGRTRFMHPFCLQSNPAPTFKFSTRYSELLCMHLELKELLPLVDLPAFPKKKWIGSRSDSFIAKRIRQLNDYFTQILQTPEVNPSEPLMRLISPHRPLNILVIGAPNVGKQFLLELFVRVEAKSFPEGRESKNSMCSQEIVKSTPVDVLLDEKLYRIANLDIKTFAGNDGQERSFLMENLTDKHGVIFMYKERGTAGHAIANRMYDMIKDKVPCILANCDINNYLNEYTVHNSQGAYLAFEALIRIFKGE